MRFRLITCLIALIVCFEFGCDNGNSTNSGEEEKDMLVERPVSADTAVASNFAFRNVKVVPITSEVVFQNQTVLIVNNTIQEMGDFRDVEIPPGYGIFEGNNSQYLMPGLNDMHTHIGTSISESGRVDQQATLEATKLELLSYLLNGVTTVLNHGDFREPVNDFARRVLEGNMKGPTMYTANFARGGVGTPDGGPPWKSVSDKSSGKAYVRSSIEQGYDFIKVYNYTPSAAFEGIMEESKIQNIPVIGHIPKPVGATTALNSGMKMVSHTAAFFWTLFNYQVKPDLVPVAVDLLQSDDAYINTTLGIEEKITAIWGGDREEFDKILNQPFIKYVHPASIEIWEKGFEGSRWNPDGSYPGQIDNNLKFMRSYTKTFYDNGIKLVAGTDSPTVLGVAGFSMHEELKAIERIGLSPFQVLEIATKNGGDFIDQTLSYARPTGTIEVGKQADVLLLNSNPLVSLDNVKDIEGVMVRGFWHTQKELQVELDELIGE